MLSTRHLFIFLLVILTGYHASALTLDKLGQRSSSCQNLEYDDFIVELDESLKKEAKNLFTDDKLTAVVILNPECFRVGTEIKLFLANSVIPYLGRALIKKIEILDRNDLIDSKNSPFTKTALGDFVKANKSGKYGLIQIQVAEKVEEQVVSDQYKRLPTCFPANSDWESMKLQSSDLSLVQDIQAGRSKAQIWNGTFNCYKIGIYTRIEVAGDTTDFGSIIPTELHLVHLSNLSQRHASLMEMSLSQLTKLLEAKKDVDGGYVTMVVYNYAEPKPEASPEINLSEFPEEDQ